MKERKTSHRPGFRTVVTMIGAALIGAVLVSPAGTASSAGTPAVQARPADTGADTATGMVVELAASVHRFRATDDLNGRAGASLGSRTVKVNIYKKGQLVPVVCQKSGGLAYGSKIWDYTSDKVWVTDAYVHTGYTGFTPGVPRCTSGGSSSTSRSFVATTDLNGRTAKKVTASYKKVYKSGSKVGVTCQAYGGYAYGSYIWDKTTDGLWVADHYLKTGTDGFVSGLKRCDNDKPSGGSGGSTNCHSGSAIHGKGGTPAAAGSKSGSAASRVAKVIAAAKAQTSKGYVYSWGAGGRHGATCGVHHVREGGDDYYRYGYDCSGLTSYIFWKGAGITIGEGTSAQWAHSSWKHPLSQRKAGDLLFLAGHVVLYLGGGKILEASPTGGRGPHNVHITNYSVYAGRYYSQVVRPIH